MCLVYWSPDVIHGKSGRSRCYAKSPTVQDAFQSIPGFMYIRTYCSVSSCG